MKHPAYTLLKLKKHTGMEGPGFRAVLARASDKKALAEVYDGGDGGPMFITPMDKDAYAEFVAYVAAQKIELDMGDGKMVEITHERESCIICDILEDLEWQKKIDRAAKDAVIFRAAGDPEDAFRKVPLRGNAREAVVAWVNSKYPNATIIA